MYMIVCDVEGCDTVEKHTNGGVIGLHPRHLPSGWKTVQMMVPPSKEETAAVERQQEEIKKAYAARFPKADDIIEDISFGYQMPGIGDRLRTFVMCSKHEVPPMKAEAQDRDNEYLMPRLSGLRQKPIRVL